MQIPSTPFEFELALSQLPQQSLLANIFKNYIIIRFAIIAFQLVIFWKPLVQSILNVLIVFVLSYDWCYMDNFSHINSFVQICSLKLI